jgi:hypothetical protein
MALMRNAAETARIYLVSAPLTELLEQIIEAEIIIARQELYTNNTLTMLGRTHENIVVQDLLVYEQRLIDFRKLLTVCKEQLQISGPEH